MAKVEWTERHERMAQRLPPADADTDPALLATVLAHLRAGCLDGLAIARREARERSKELRRESCDVADWNTYVEKNRIDYFARSWPETKPANHLWWRLFELACEVFDPPLQLVARSTFAIRGVTHSSAHRAASDIYADTTGDAHELLESRVEDECDYEFERMSKGVLEIARPSGALARRAKRVRWCDIPGRCQAVLWNVLKTVPAGTRFSAGQFANGADDSTIRKILDSLCEMEVLCKAKGERSPYFWTIGAKPKGVPKLRPS